jgi:hypothetical protein
VEQLLLDDEYDDSLLIQLNMICWRQVERERGSQGSSLISLGEYLCGGRRERVINFRGSYPGVGIWEFLVGCIIIK